MNYKLAKQLKDAGWNQEEPHSHGEYYTYIDNKGVQRYSNELIDEYDPCKIPTLSELIDACGDGFLLLNRTNIGSWYIQGRRKGKDVIHLLETKSLKSPEEVVAKLWLKLNNN